jgi:hypothetical protein
VQIEAPDGTTADEADDAEPEADAGIAPAAVSPPFPVPGDCGSPLGGGVREQPADATSSNTESDDHAADERTASLYRQNET